MSSDDDPGHPHWHLGMLEMQRIAEAFELTREEVLRDWDLVRDWSRPRPELLEQLQQRHGWDTTVAPFYTLWLRGKPSVPPI